MANDDDKRAAKAFADDQAELCWCAGSTCSGCEAKTRVLAHKSFLAGIAYLREKLMKGAPEFETASATISAHAKHDEYRAKCFTYNGGTEEHWFVEGARWQHEQSRLRQEALREQIEFHKCRPCEQAVKERDAALAEAADAIKDRNDILAEWEDFANGSGDVVYDRLKRELAECYEGKAALVEDVQGSCLDLTAERERAKGLVEALERVSLYSPDFGSVADEALAAYRNQTQPKKD